MEKRQEIQNLERRILQKESHLDKKVELIETREEDINRRERSLNQQEKAVSEQEKKLTGLIEKERLQLESIARMSAEEAKRFLMETMENEAKHEAAKEIKRIEEEAKRDGRQEIKRDHQSCDSAVCRRLCGRKNRLRGQPAQ